MGKWGKYSLELLAQINSAIVSRFVYETTSHFEDDAATEQPQVSWSKSCLFQVNVHFYEYLIPFIQVLTIAFTWRKWYFTRNFYEYKHKENIHFGQVKVITFLYESGPLYKLDLEAGLDSSSAPT